MQFIDLSQQQSKIRDNVLANINEVLSHGQYINGPEVQEIEEALAAYVGSKYAVGCASGTDALLLGLMSLGVGPGDAIFTTPFTFIATAEVISLLGATPISIIFLANGYVDYVKLFDSKNRLILGNDF